MKKIISGRERGYRFGPKRDDVEWRQYNSCAGCGAKGPQTAPTAHGVSVKSAEWARAHVCA